MTKELVLFILNIVFALFLVIGFLLGLKGLKKSGVRFTCFIVAMLIALFITPVISKAVMNIQVTIDGSKITLNDYVLQLINSVPEIGDITTKSPTIQKLISNFPIMIGNIFVFVILSYVLSFLSWIVYLVFASVINKNYKAKKEKGEKVKKHRLLGGLVGTVQALLLVGITFLPVCGFVGIINEIQNSVDAEEVTTVETTSATAKILDENLPEEVKVIISAYNSSAVSKVGNVFGLGDKLFNDIASVSVDNTKIALRDEVINLSKVYDNASFLLDTEITVDNISSLDYDKLITATNYVFDSNILKSALPDFFNYFFDELIARDDVKDNQDLLDILEVVKTDITNDNKTVENLKIEVNCVLKLMKTLAKSGIIDELPLGEREAKTDNLVNILNILSNDDKKVFNDIIDICFESKILNRAVVYGLSTSIYKVEDELKELANDDTITLTKLNLKDSNLVVKKAEVKSLLSSLLNIGNDVKDYKLDEIKDDIRLAFELPLGDILKNIGTSMNAIQNMTIFVNNGIYNEIMDAMAKTEYKKYINFDVLKQNNIWVTETQDMANVIDKFISSNIISYIEKAEDGSYSVKTENISKIIDKLDDITVINGQNKSLLSQILEPIYDSKMFKNSIDFGFEKMSDFVKDAGKNIAEDCNLGELYLEKIHDEDEKAKILTFLNNTIAYAKNLDFDKLKDDPFYTIAESDLTLLGQCLDSLKASLLFADYDGHNGVYSNLVDGLNKTKFSEYVDFNCTLRLDFRFNQEFNNIQDSVTKLVTTNIVTETETMTLLKYIVDVGDFDVIFKQIDKTELKEIFTPLMQSELLRPLGVIVVNKINEQVKDIVGDYGLNIPTDLTELDEKQIEQVIEVMGSMSDIIEDVTKEDFDLPSYIKGDNSNKIIDVLETLQDNATSEDGVFKLAYDAMVEYIKNDEEIGESMTTIIEKNTNEGKIDWASVVAELKSMGE